MPASDSPAPMIATFVIRSFRAIAAKASANTGEVLESSAESPGEILVIE